MNVWVCDTECYSNYFLIMFRNIESGETMVTEMFPGKPVERWVCPPPDATIVTFNGINYDFPTMSLAFAGADNETLKAASDDIIINQLKHWHIRDKYGGVDLSGVDHIDLIEVAPGQCGLKAYGGRLHSQRLQDLPLDPAMMIQPEHRAMLREYCGNDLRVTEDLYCKLTPQIDLRCAMSKEFGIDLRSKSDAQIAEAVIRSEVEKRVGHRVYKPDVNPRYQFNYILPTWVQFMSPGMNQLLAIVKDSKFTLDDKGSVEIPAALESMRLRIGNGVYRMGVGGLHSSETCVAHKCDLVDRDVTSYYPSIILNLGLYPSHLGMDFLSVYGSLVQRRIDAKMRGDKVMADALKICVNGSFGKLGSKWSVLYSPDLLIQVTITGQLALLMLIEMLEGHGIEVVSANTDGVVCKKHDLLHVVVAYWEAITGFNTEETKYTALYSKDVNNFIAVKSDGTTKLKGLYAPSGMQKNNTNEVCVEAVIAFITNGTPIEMSICGQTDIRKFLTIRQVKGGAKYGDRYLGKVVRWFYAKNERRYISYSLNGNKVARSDGARPMMELLDHIPNDLNYDWYVREANSILSDIGG